MFWDHKRRCPGATYIAPDVATWEKAMQRAKDAIRGLFPAGPLEAVDPKWYRPHSAAPRRAIGTRRPEISAEEELAYWKADAEKRHRVADRLASERRRSRGASVGWESVDPQEIYRRDHWVCQLCWRRVKPAPGVDGPSLDHIVPVADGGAFTRENLQLAHRRCNSKKGRRDLIPSQLRMLP